MPNNAIQLWSPDTCECVIHMAYDDSLPPGARVFTYVSQSEAQSIHQARINAKVPNTNPNPQPPAVICHVHASIGAVTGLFTAVRSENARKNMTLALGQNVAPTITNDSYSWSFDAQRVLQVSFFGVTVNTSQRNNVQAACDIQFGPGKVKIN